jgi:CubicO group peptidase (beta-lactamase class C family)
VSTLLNDIRYGLRMLGRSPSLAAIALCAGVVYGASAPRASLPNSMVEEYTASIPKRMAEEGIPGVAVAVVDDQAVLWAAGFGYTDWDRRTPVTPDTPFSIQSMSKSFTATAVLMAVQDGLVDLNTPVSTLLPAFHVNSIFEERPEQRMTLLTLLSHTAGFTHEAPVGGNYDHPCRSFEDHVGSISQTWLKFPAGRKYAYSNLGIDLAGYVLQVRSGTPFTKYVRDKVFTPLGMKNSTLDVGEIRALRNQAVGHGDFPLRMPVGWLIIPSGGVWTTAADMARYLRFHINRGSLEHRQWLREDLAETLYAPPNEAARQANYALGIAVSSRHGARRLQHGGGGYGFNSNMVWYPELKLGAVVLTNKVHRRLNSELADEILDRIIDAEPNLYADRARQAPASRPSPNPSAKGSVLSDAELADLIARCALPADEAALQRRKGYVGRYVSTCFGFPGRATEVKESGGELFYDSGQMTEALPGLFFLPQGEALDLRGQRLSFRNIPLFRVNDRVLPWRVASYALCGLIFFSALVFWPVRALIRRVRPAQGVHRQTGPLWPRLLGMLAALSGLVLLGPLVLIPHLSQVPWPVPYRQMQWWAVAILGLPYAGLVLASCTGLGIALGWRTTLRSERICYVAAAAGVLAFNAVVLM